MAWKRILIFAFAIVLVLLVINTFGFFQVIGALSRANIFLVLIAALIQLGILGLQSARLRVLSHDKGYISYRKVLRTALSGAAVSLMTPFAMIGGEPLKMYMLRTNIGSSKSSAVVAIDGLMEIIASIFVIFVVVVLFIGTIPSNFFMFFVLFLIAIGLILGTMLKILFTPRWLNKIIGWIVKKVEKSQNNKVDYPALFQEAFASIINNRRKLAGVFCISSSVKVLEMLRLWLVFAAIGISLPMNVAVVGWAIMVVLLFVPILPGSLAILEFGATSAFILLGIAPAIAISAVLVDRFLSFWLVLFIGFGALSYARKLGELPFAKKELKK
ncbi:MAG: flippase-like domain-containing protein [Candidatus Aenigmarchaeota archaeon]|nr:flippase-like domain-containing protein [Candidatus Aenigmarchaeota archaeon]